MVDSVIRYYCVYKIKQARGEDNFISHEYRKNFGKIELNIEALTPIFVGSGEFDLENGKQYQCFYKKLGEFVIPGSTLKGVIRSYAEALSPSCIKHNCEFGNLCYVCAIFGSRNYASRITVTDSDFIKGERKLLTIEERYSPRKSCGGMNSNVIKGERKLLKIEERYSPQESCGGMKFYHHYNKVFVQQGGERIEAIEKGATAQFTIYYRNLTNWELGLIFLSLGLSKDYPFYLKLGGGKAQGLGSIKITLKSMGNYNVENYIQEYLKKIEKGNKEYYNKVIENLQIFKKDSKILGGINK